ncbi:DUF3833 domain-containing protein [Ostreiculturibacter nitratireducens]|uniref:DUF3833 domain-containing protein n=1 Tax=Ostreiculturibacter nitratireducens TaxID=3075226 RepID=UPI0031B5CE61
MNTFLLIALGAVLTLSALSVAQRFTGFGAQKPEHYAGQRPEFDIRRELSGPILCEGVIYGPLGRVTSRFVADMDADWEGNACRMTEAFRYDSGATQDRVWTLTLGNDGVIRAEAPDLDGTGHGRQEGSAVMLRYRIRLPEDAGGHVLSVTDWMYLAPNGTIINRSQFRKFGIKVAELVATMRRVQA